MLNNWFLEIVVCPTCHSNLEYDSSLFCKNCNKKFPIIEGIPRFVELNEYESFGFQWNRFSKSQIDLWSNNSESKIRFINETNFINKIKNKIVLDVGAGSGRFADIALQAGAKVVCLDLSSAVNACHSNLSNLNHDSKNFQVIQASIYDMPFKSVFEFVYSLGVIQHTPNRRKAIECISDVMKKNGTLSVWVYEKSWRSLLGYKYYFRIITKKLSIKSNWIISHILLYLFFIPAYFLFHIPLVGKYLVRFLPLAFRKPEKSISFKQSFELSLLDTFDNLSPLYDNPLTNDMLKKELIKNDFYQIYRNKTPGLSITCTKK